MKKEIEMSKFGYVMSVFFVILTLIVAFV